MAANTMVTISNSNSTLYLPNPSFYDAVTVTIVDSGRNAEGITKGAVIRDDLAKVSLKWRYLSAQDWSQILTMFKTSAGGQFANNVTFFDQTSASFITRLMYVSDRSAGGWKINHSTGAIIGWTDCSLSLVEV